MYENMTSERLESRMLGRIPETLDKREGSIIFDATAPAAIELAEAYIMARVILRQTFATTADRPYLKPKDWTLTTMARWGSSNITRTRPSPRGGREMN